MKKPAYLYTAILSCLLSVCSCIEPADVILNTSDTPFDYDIAINDEIQLPVNGGDYELTFTVMASGSSTEDVEIWLEGVPEKILTKIEPKTVKPTANVTLTFTDNNNIKHGFYPAVLHTKSVSGIKKEFPFTLKVMEKRCTDYFTGNYNGPTNCIPGLNGKGFLNITEDRTEKNQILFWWADYTRRAKINCYDGTMTFLEQKLGDSTFSGHATYSEDHKTVTMTYIIEYDNGQMYTCTGTYNKD